MKFEFGLVVLACALTAANVMPESGTPRPSDLPKLGVYDPNGLMKKDKRVSIEHVFVDWQTFQPAEFRRIAAAAADGGRDLLVTVEPWTRAANRRDGRETLLANINSGTFDREIATICREIGAAETPVMVSWGHEMDEVEGRFPWANQDPELYKSAYRRFVDGCRTHAPTVRFGWTPKGEETLGAYYPGSQHVDFVGLTLFDSQAWNRDHGEESTFQERFGALHRRVAGYGKPVILAEFGVEGDELYREQALSCVREQLRKFSGVEAVVYFNDQETWSWPAPYGRPDWRVASGRVFQCEDTPASGATGAQAQSDSPVAVIR